MTGYRRLIPQGSGRPRKLTIPLAATHRKPVGQHRATGVVSVCSRCLFGLHRHYTFVIDTFAAAWHGGLRNAAQYAGNAQLRTSISSAMNYWFSNDFTNPACLDFGGTATCPCSTPGFWNQNWSSNVSIFSLCLYLLMIHHAFQDYPYPGMGWTSLPVARRQPDYV